jgi:hypothetical protein
MGLSEAVSRQMALTDRMSAATHVLPPDAGLAPTGVTSPPVGSEPLTPEAAALSPSGVAPLRNERVDSAPLAPRGGVPQPGVGADSDSRGLAGREQNDGRAMPEVRIEMESLVAAIPESPRPAAAPPTESDRLAVVPLGRAGPSRSRSTRPHTPQASARGGSASVRAEATQRRPAPLPKSTLRLVLVTLALGVLLAGGAAILAVMKTRSRAGGGGGDAAAEVNPFLAKEFNFLSLPVSPKLTLIVDGFSKLPSQSEALVAGAKGLGTGVTVQVIALTDDAPRAFPDPPRWLRPQDADELGKFLAGHRSSFAPGAERVDEAFALAVKGKPAQVVLITDQALDPDGLSKAEEHLGAIKGVRFDVLSTRPDENVKGMCQRLGGAFVLLKADTLSRWLNEAAAAAPAPGNAPAPAPGTAPAPAPGTAPAPKPGK